MKGKTCHLYLFGPYSYEYYKGCKMTKFWNLKRNPFFIVYLQSLKLLRLS